MPSSRTRGGERLLDRVSPIFGREELFERLEQAMEDVSCDRNNNNQPKQKEMILLHGQSGLSKVRLVELACGVYNDQHCNSSNSRRSSSDSPRSSSDGGSAVATFAGLHVPRKRKAPCPCWYGFAQFTKRQEERPFAELSRSIAEIVTHQLLPEFQRLSGASDAATSGGTAMSGGRSSGNNNTFANDPSFCDLKMLLRERLNATDVNVLIRFCPEVEQLHLYSKGEIAVEQTIRMAKAAKDSAVAVTDLVGRGLAMVAPTYFSTPKSLSSSLNSQKSGLSDATPQQRAPSNQLERLKYVVKLLFRALSEVRPLVWVLDDLQYATKDGLASLSFIESLLDDPELNRFLFFGIVRDDDSTKKELKTLQQWTKMLPKILHLKMKPMEDTNVKSMLHDLLRIEGDDLEQVSSLIYQRTHGNDFFIFEMINYLQQEGVIYFSTKTYRWQCDIDEAKRKTMLSENVLSFVGRRLKQLSVSVQRYLKYAAFLGYRFDEDLLAKVVRADFSQSQQDTKRNDVDIHALLKVAVNEGFIEELSYPNVIRYKFVHIEIQTECEHLVEEKGDMSANNLHWNIGAALWRGWRKLDSYENIENRILFPCVKELNTGRYAYKPRKETIDQLARLNHEAAKRSFELHAFFPASSYLETAISLMGRSAWLDHYEVSLELHTFLAKMYLASGQIGKIPSIVRVVGERAKSFLDRLPVDLVELARCKMLGYMYMHVQKSISMLNLLGVSLSGDYFWFQTERMKKRVKLALVSLSDEDVQAKTISSSSLESSTIEYVIQGLIHTLVFSAEYKTHLDEEYPNLETAVACKMVEAFVNEKTGPDGSALCLALAACLFCEAEHDHGFMRRFCRWLSFSKDQADLSFSIRLAELALKAPSTDNELQTMAVTALVRHWRLPLPKCVELTLKSYNVGMESGDLRTAANAAVGYIQLYLFSGLPLAFLAKDIDSILAVMIDYNQIYDAVRICPVYQLILNLTGQSSDVTDLTSGSAIERASAIGWNQSLEASPDSALLLYTHCQEYGKAAAVFEKLETSNLGIVRFHAAWHVRIHMLALVAIHNARKSILRSIKWRRRARKYVSLMQSWVDDCQAINLGHKLKLLEAEMLTLHRAYPADDVLMKAYNEAIIRSARSGFLQDAALAAVLASNAVRDKFEKHQFARRAQEFYASWDAYGIISHLRRKSRIFRESYEPQLAQSSTSGQGIQGRQRFLDEDGILRVHRSITAAEDKVQKEMQQACEK